MTERHQAEIIGLTSPENSTVSRLIFEHAYAEAAIMTLLKGRKVRFKGWFTGGVQRTGTIVSAQIHGKLVTLGVDVDRIDGRPGFARREGVLADSWYGPADSVEVMQ